MFDSYIDLNSGELRVTGDRVELDGQLIPNVPEPLTSHPGNCSSVWDGDDTSS